MKFYLILLILAKGCILQASIQGAASNLGLDFFKENSNTGVFSENISIKVPRERNNLQPSLNLSYSSFSGNSIMGLGWGMNVPIISKTRSGFAPFLHSKNGAIESIDGNVYLPKILDKIIKHIFNPKENIWVVYYTNGVREIYEGFGHKYDRLITNHWYLTKVYSPECRGKTENCTPDLLYEYDISEFEVKISRINYNLSNTNYYSKVKFFYQKRTDQSVSYFNGVKYKKESLLSEVQVENGQEIINSYKVSYNKPQGLINFSTVRNIRSYINDELDVETKYSYSGESGSFGANWDVKKIERAPVLLLKNKNLGLLDVDGDGLLDIYSQEGLGKASFILNDFRYHESDYSVKYDEIEINKKISYPTSPLSRMYFMDVDGDGYIDQVPADGGKYYAKRKKGGSYEMIEANGVFPMKPNQTFVLDMNSDGLQDYFLFYKTDTVLCIENKGGLNFEQKKLTNKSLDASFKPSNKTLKTGDFNGDGLVDVMQFELNQLQIYLNNGHCNFDNPIVISYKDNSKISMLQLKNTDEAIRIRINDINEDGYSDIISQIRTKETVIFFGDTDLKFSKNMILPGLEYTDSMYIFDFDGDGSKEIVECPNGLGKCNSHNIIPETKPGLMLRVENNKGVMRSVKYNSSAKYNQDRDDKKWMPIILPVLSEITRIDGVLAKKTVSYDYKSGYYDPTSMRFLGFSYVTEKHSPSKSYFDESEIFIPEREITTRYNTGILYRDDLLGVASAGTVITRNEPNDSLFMQYDIYERVGNFAKLLLRQVISGYETEESQQLMLKKTYYNEQALPVKDEIYLNAEKKWSLDSSVVNGELYKTTTKDYLKYGNVNEVSDEKIYYVKTKEVVSDSNGVILESSSINYKKSDGLLRLVKKTQKINDSLEKIRSYNYDEQFPLLVSKVLDSQGQRLEEYKYDELGLNVISRINGEGHTFYASHDPVTNLLFESIDSNNVKTIFEYDNKNRVKIRKQLKGTSLLSYSEYDYVEHSKESPKIDTELKWLDNKGKRKSLKVSYKTINDKLLAELESGPKGKIALNKAFIYNDDYLEVYSLNEPVLTECNDFYICDFNSILTQSPHKVKYYDSGLRVSDVFWPLEQKTEKFDFKTFSNKNAIYFNDKNGHQIITYKDIFDKVIGKEYRSEEGIQVYKYDYDPLDRLINVVMPSGQERKYNFNQLGLITSFTQDNNIVFTNNYNSEGLLQKKKWGDGQVEFITYNNLRLPILKTYLDSKGNKSETEFVYGISSSQNNVGRLIEIINNSLVETMSYNAQGLVEERVKTFKNKPQVFLISSSYNFSGQLVKKDLNGSLPLEYKYDSSDKLESVPGFVDSMIWYSPLKLASYQLSNSVVVNQDYNYSTFFLETIDITGKDYRSNYKYYYDAVGNIERRIDNEGSQINYIYNDDITYKLKEYIYDKNKFSYSFDLDNGLIQKDKLERSESGQLENFKDVKYQFGPNRRLSQIRKEGNQFNILYDGYDLPAIESSKNYTVYHLDENYSLVNGKPQLRILIQGKVVAEVQQHDKQFIVSDYINTPLEYFNIDGEVINKVVIDPFGNYLKVINKDLLPQYTTGMAGLYYNSASETYSMGTRFYNPKAGEFVRMDQLAVNEPVKFLDNQIELNLFQYARNNPANYTDPTGEEAVSLYPGEGSLASKLDAWNWYREHEEHKNIKAEFVFDYTANFLFGWTGAGDTLSALSGRKVSINTSGLYQDSGKILTSEQRNDAFANGVFDLGLFLTGAVSKGVSKLIKPISFEEKFAKYYLKKNDLIVEGISTVDSIEDSQRYSEEVLKDGN